MMHEEEPKSNAGARLALSGMQEEAVNRAFEKLFGYPWGTYFAFHHGETSDSKVSLSRQENLLCEIFGAETAAQILLKNPTLQKKEIKVVRKPQYYKTPKPSASSAVSQPAPTASSKSQAATAPRKGGVQNLLQELSGPQTTTTVAKTHADWGQFKEQTGLGDKLEEQAESKAAFLKRQDFLERVDHRKFELEKKDRERERMQRK
jgi:hypothetical protein